MQLGVQNVHSLCLYELLSHKTHFSQNDEYILQRIINLQRFYKTSEKDVKKKKRNIWQHCFDIYWKEVGTCISSFSLKGFYDSVECLDF